MIQHVIMFVGPDRCGKTNIAKELEKRLGIPYFKPEHERLTYLESRSLMGGAVGFSVEDCQAVIKFKQNTARQRFLHDLHFADPRMRDFLTQTKHSVIMDRGFPCEWAYSQVMGREFHGPAIIERAADWMTIPGFRIVFCHRSSYEGVIDDLDPALSNHTLQRLHNEYERFFRRMSPAARERVLWLNVDDEVIEREIAEVMAFVGVQVPGLM